MDIFDRVKMLAKRQNISVSALEQELGYGNGSLYPHTKDATIRGDRVVELAKYFNVTTDWLLTGDSGERLSYNEWKLVDSFRQMNETQREELQDLIDFLLRYRNSSKKDNTIDDLEKAD